MVSNENGDYIIPFLAAGRLHLTFELQGFRTQQRDGVAVVIAETLQVDIRLAVAGVTRDRPGDGRGGRPRLRRT